ncbi:MAG TPA: hypothetical protein VN222_03325, partial [Novosphingobium sp.]|nr:hypothetical protein [Novosphingobium sp.]
EVEPLPIRHDAHEKTQYNGQDESEFDNGCAAIALTNPLDRDEPCHRSAPPLCWLDCVSEGDRIGEGRFIEFAKQSAYFSEEADAQSIDCG